MERDARKLVRSLAAALIARNTVSARCGKTHPLPQPAPPDLRRVVVGFSWCGNWVSSIRRSLWACPRCSSPLRCNTRTIRNGCANTRPRAHDAASGILAASVDGGAGACPSEPVARPKEPTHSGGVVNARLEAPVLEGMGNVAGSRGATVFMAGFAAFHALLQRLSGTRDIVIGTPAANRPMSDLENVVGIFIKFAFTEDRRPRARYLRGATRSGEGCLRCRLRPSGTAFRSHDRRKGRSVAPASVPDHVRVPERAFCAPDLARSKGQATANSQRNSEPT